MAIINTVFDNFIKLPESIQIASTIFFTLFFVVKSIALLQSEQLKRVYIGTPIFLKWLGNRLKNEVHDPLLKFPRIQRGLHLLNIVNCYSMSILLFVYFILLMLLFAAFYDRLSIIQVIGLICFNIVCAYASALLKAQASKELLSFRKSKS